MRGAATSLDDDLRTLATFRRRFRTGGVVAQLVEHHNGIVPPQVVVLAGRSVSDAMSQRGDLPALPAPDQSIPSLAVAVADMLRAKEASRRRPSYVRSLRQYLAAFIRGREQTPISHLTHFDLDEWFSARSEAPATRASNIGRLSALFSYAVRRGWLTSNPCHRLERIRIDHTPPKILTVPQASAILTASGPTLRPWVVLGLFAGMRPAEAERLDWSAVRIAGENPCVVVDAAASKMRRRRIVPLCPCAVSWLGLDVSQNGRIVSSHSTLRRARREASEVAGVPWSQDVLRHTYASYRMGRGDSADVVAHDMGNSPRILLTHYRELVTREDAADFWRIRPPLPA